MNKAILKIVKTLSDEELKTFLEQSETKTFGLTTYSSEAWAETMIRKIRKDFNKEHNLCPSN
jgi:hypothetical protein